MASLFRPTYTKIDRATGRRVTRKVRKWYCKYRDAAGRLRCKPLSPVKTVAMAMLTDLVRRIEYQKAGLVDDWADHLQQPIAAALEEYRRHLDSKARSPKHVSELVRIIHKVVAACGLSTLADLQGASERLERHLAERREAGVSHRTVDGDLVALRSFCRWLVQRKRMHDDPTRTLARLNQDLDRRRTRRALSDHEVWKLYSTTKKSQRVVSRLTGSDRAVLYLFALRTGLRRGELRSLTTGSFDFSSTPATVTVEAPNSKHRQVDVLPMAADVAAVVRDYVVGREFDADVWPGAWWCRASQMLARDLAEAGLQSTDKEGRIVDFHALRTTSITALARAGVQPAMAQKLARHSDINLTLGVYTQLNLCELADAVSRLPQVNLMGEAVSTFATNAS